MENIDLIKIINCIYKKLKKNKINKNNILQEKFINIKYENNDEIIDNNDNNYNYIYQNNEKIINTSEYKSIDYYNNLNLLLENIRKNINIMEKYNLYDKDNKNNLWNDIVKPYYNSIISEKLINQLGLDNITKIYIDANDIDNSPNFQDFVGNLKNINDWKLHLGGFNKKNVENILDIKIIPYRELQIQNKKIISFSLFNVKFIDFNTPYNYNTNERKPPHFYTKVLNNAIDTYKKYMPDWILRLYIDETIPIENYENQVSLPLETKKILKRFMTEDNMELLSIKSNYLIDKKNLIKHMKLTPVIFRYLSFFDENVISCFVADIDNTCTALIANLLNNFQKSKNKFIIFKPVKSYDRPYFNDKCIDNFLAGMIGFNKDQGTIFNYKIWHSLYRFFDTFYNELKSDIKYEKCTVKILVESPFYYGFEESGFTIIFSYLINKFNLDVYLIPLYWDYGMDTSEMISYYIIKNQLYSLTDEFIMFLFDLMKIKLNLNKSENIILLNSFKHSPILIIISNIIYHLHFNNIDEIINPYTNLNIKIFKNKKLLNSVLSVFPFVSGYTFDFKEVANDTSVCDIYGDEISTEIIKLIDLFEKTKYIEFKNKINELYNNIKTNIFKKSKTDKIYITYKNTLEKNPNSILFDLEHPYSFSSLINNQFINYDLINNIQKYDNLISNLNILLFKPLDMKNIFQKEYDYIISLGDQFLDTFLFANNLKKEYYPFELMVLNLNNLSHMINTNFKEIINIHNYIEYNQPETYQMKKTTSFNIHYNNLFNINLNIKKNYYFLMTSIENFKKVKNNINAKKLFIMHIEYENTNPNDKYNYYYIYEQISDIITFLSNMDILIIITSVNNEYKENVIINYEFDNGNILIINHIYTKSNHTAKEYLNENDNIMINNIFKNINYKNKHIPNVDDYFKEKNVIINELNKFKSNSNYNKFLENFDENYLLKIDTFNKILKLLPNDIQNSIKENNRMLNLLIISLYKKGIMFPYEFIYLEYITYKENLCIKKIINVLSENIIKQILIIFTNDINVDINNYIYYQIEFKNLLKNLIDNNINVIFGQLGIINCAEIKLLGIGGSSTVYQIKDKAVKISVSTGKTYYNYYEYKNFKKIISSRDEYLKLYNIDINEYIINYYEHFYIDSINNRYLMYDGTDVYLDCLVMEKIDDNLFNGIIKNNIDKSYGEKLFNTLLRTLHIFHFNKLIHNDLIVTNISYIKNNNDIKFKIIDYGDMCNVNDTNYILCNISRFGGWKNLIHLLRNDRQNIIHNFDILKTIDTYLLILLMYDFYNLSFYKTIPITTTYLKNINYYINKIFNKNSNVDIEINTLENKLNDFNNELLFFIENIPIQSIKEKCKLLFNDNGQTDLNNLLTHIFNNTFKNKYLKYKKNIEI